MEMIIRRLSEADLSTRVLWMNNPDIYSSMHFEIPITMEKTRMWFERNLSKEDRLDVVVEDDNVIVAFGGYTSIDRKNGKAETYLFADPVKHHKGIGTRAKLLMCKYGFEELNLNKLYFVANEDNYPIIKVNEKCGFVLEGRLRQEYMTASGEFKDMLYYGLLKRDWDKNNLNGSLDNI